MLHISILYNVEHKSTHTMCCLNGSKQLFLLIPDKVKLPWEATAALAAPRKIYIDRHRKQLWLPKARLSSDKAKIQSINGKVNILSLQSSLEILDHLSIERGDPV